MNPNWPHWYYRGRVTHPVNIPGRGPIVLTPRSRFQAPTAAVSDLVRAKLVVRIEAPPVKEGQSTAPVPASEKPAPAKESVADKGSDAADAKPEESAADKGSDAAGEQVSAAAAEAVVASNQPKSEEEEAPGGSKSDPSSRSRGRGRGRGKG